MLLEHGLVQTVERLRWTLELALKSPEGCFMTTVVVIEVIQARGDGSVYMKAFASKSSLAGPVT